MVHGPSSDMERPVLRRCLVRESHLPGSAWGRAMTDLSRRDAHQYAALPRRKGKYENRQVRTGSRRCWPSPAVPKRTTIASQSAAPEHCENSFV